MLSGSAQRCTTDWLASTVISRDNQERCRRTDFECVPERPGDTASHQSGHGDRQRNQCRNERRHVSGQRPIDDPRREAKQNAHDRSVYERRHSGGSLG